MDNITVLQQLQQAFLMSLSTDGSEFLAHLKPLASLLPIEILDLYRKGLKAEAIRLLRPIFPVCQRLLGEALFATTATECMRFHPPQTDDFALFAADFVEFIVGNRIFADEFPYIADMLRLELQVYQLLRCSDSSVLDMEVFAKIAKNSQEQITFQLPAGAVLMQSKYPLDEIFTVNQTDFNGNSLVDLTPRKFQFLVWRAGFGICIDRLTEEEWLVLEKIAVGASFVKLCNDLSYLYPTLNIASIFPRLVKQGWITGFH